MSLHAFVPAFCRALRRTLFRMQAVKYRLFGARIPSDTLFMGRVFIDGNMDNLELGSDVALNHGVYINCRDRVSLGDHAILSAGVHVLSAGMRHDILPRREHVTGPVSIGAGCWIGAKAVILPGVELGPGTVVGAGAVVAESFPQGRCLLLGVPARVARSLDTDKPSPDTPSPETPCS